MQLPVIPVCALGTAAALCAGCGKTPAERPNIIIIYADDVGYGDFSCNGSPTIQTPNVDRLASEGVRFTNAHTTSSTSTPARYGLLTGQYPWRQGRDGDCGGECRNDHIARTVYAGRHAARRGLRHRSRRKVASGLGRDGPAGLERRHCAGPERYRVRLFVHHGRHGRPCALRIYRKPARRRARSGRSHLRELCRTLRGRADRPGQSRIAGNDPVPRARPDHRQRDFPHRVYEGRQGGLVEGRPDRPTGSRTRPWSLSPETGSIRFSCISGPTIFTCRAYLTPGLPARAAWGRAATQFSLSTTVWAV